MPAPEASLLGQVNPLSKLAAAIVYMVAITAIFDPVAQASVLVLATAALLALERVPLRRFLATMAPFAIMGFGFWWTSVVFQRESATYVDSLGRFSLVRNPGFDAGLVVFLRAINYGALSYLFVQSTRPPDLALALMQHARVPPAVAFAVFGAVQFVPALRDDLRQLRLAQRLRGARAPWHRRPALYFGLLVPMLVSAVRRAQRSAISMEARGLARPMTRSYLRRSTFGRSDVYFIAISATLIFGIVALSMVRFSA